MIELRSGEAVPADVALEVGTEVSIDGFKGKIDSLKRFARRLHGIRYEYVSIRLRNDWGQRTKPFSFRSKVESA